MEYKIFKNNCVKAIIDYLTSIQMMFIHSIKFVK
jgi:hypothetical protein